MSDEATFPLARAELIAFFLESMIFGAFTVLYAIAIWILLYREKKRSKSTLNKMLFGTSTLMWVLSVTHLCIDVVRAVQGFVDEGGKPDGTLNFYSDLANPTHVAKNVIYITMTIVGDTFVTYRLYIVWNRAWWIVVLPGLLLLATAVSGYGACVEIGMVKGQGAIFAENLQPWIRAFFSISLTTNILATLLIAARIVYSNRRVKHFRAAAAATSHWEVVETLIQSAAVYSAALASLLGTYLAGSNAQYVCLDALQPLIGVVFTLIIIRVGLGYTMNEISGNKDTDHFPSTAVQSIGGTEYGMRPLAINVSVTRTNDRQSLEMYDQKDRSLGEVESGTSRTE
ncbi:hypothetical protein K466DRAFT_484278 [Polyporus arcularius HHB13444]|uniref:Fungal pheromone STE3G-protein-coupled receptor n=1 Tax=Polyporus arcularius HHB13444 TaxID=1314778 RepID=A0A5C3PP22_9APHY|nr:hypothetical protein K466DRAFT_484278 [Polyporus arcularius HHB13444]